MFINLHIFMLNRELLLQTFSTHSALLVRSTRKPLVKALRVGLGSHVKAMTNRTPVSPLAMTAIAAVLALAPTPVLAQEAAAPDPAPVAAPAPPAASVVTPAPIVIPEMRSAPVVQAAPQTPAIAEPGAIRTPAARAAPRQAARTASTTAAAPVAVAAAPAATTVVPVISSEPVPVTVEVPQVTAADPATQTAAPAQHDNTAVELGLLGLVALSGATAYGLARRRRRVNQAEVVYTDDRLAAPEPIVAPTVAPKVTMATSAWAPAVAPAALASERTIERSPAAATSLGTAIPAGPLPTGPALAALFERMAAAAPDTDNPFTTYKRRRQRVRWLMKQHEYRVREAQGQPFDFRTHAAAPQPNRVLVNA